MRRLTTCREGKTSGARRCYRSPRWKTKSAKDLHREGVADTLAVDISDLFSRGNARGAIDDQLADLLATIGVLDMLTACASLTSDSHTALVGLMRTLQKVA
jgi:hypothetical protein